jgi:benzil reductase ((S)-benzoin forming)
VRATVITGVSRGLGAELFDELVAAGDRVLALGRRFTHAQREAARAEPGRIVLRPTDLSDPASLPGPAELAAFVADQHGEVALVHNAAVFEPFGPIGTLDTVRLALAVTVNLTAPMLLTNALFTAEPAPTDADPSTATRRITVLFISSGAAHRISGGRSVYASTKRAGETFMESLRMERADDRNVRVAIVDPGIMDTEMQAVVRSHALRDSYFPDRNRFLDRYERGEIPSPGAVARKIMREHLAGKPEA